MTIYGEFIHIIQIRFPLKPQSGTFAELLRKAG